MKWGAFIGLLAVAVLGWGALHAWTEPAVIQPVEFPHRTHVELDLKCTTCHERAEKDAVAGRPPTELCLSCHADGGSAELKKVQAFEKRGEIPWKRVWRLPPHVYFPHRTHVTVAQIRCQTCHGPMETLLHPPSRPLKTLAMSDCLACHEQRLRDAKSRPAGDVVAARSLTDCTSCHR
jgi:hypothetical protein